MTAVVAPSDAETFRSLALARLGLHFDDVKLPFLADVMRDRMGDLGVSQVRSYLDRVSEGDHAEVRALASHLTVGETYFFRYWDHFRAFNDLALAEVSRRAAGLTRLRILSAGCASGEEAYTLAILLREHLPDVAASDIKIQAVDVNPEAIERATRARYSTWSLRETPPDIRERYFRPVGRDLELSSTIREMVSFAEQNLAQDDSLFWREDAFDIIFCRNVMMYFTPAVMAATVARLARSLRPGGHLFLGHAETLRGVSQDFHLCHTHGCFYYRHKEAAERVPGELSHLSPSALTAPSAAEPPLPDGSWFEAIQRASDRISRLVPLRHAAEPAPDAPVARPPSPSPDLAPAVELVRQERFDAAMELLQALPSHFASDPDALLLRAVVLTNSGQLAAAADTCKEILKRDELSSGAHYLIALSCEHNGDSAGAIEHDRIAAYLDAKFAMPRLHLGLLSRRAGELEEARTQLHLALGLLVAEDPSRILLFGGGFSRETLLALCRSELHRCGGAT